MHRQTIISILAVTAAMLAWAEMSTAQIRHVLSKARSLYQKDTVTICVMGDMMMHSAQIGNAFRGGDRYDFRSYFKALEERISNADLAIANMEFTLAGEPYSGYPAFSAPDSYAEYLADCGFDVFLAANNHIFDKGSEGAARTLEKYRDIGRSHRIRYCGLAMDEYDRKQTYPLILKVKGMVISIVNCTYGTNLGAERNWPKVNYMNDRTRLKEALEDSEEADFILVLPHWGNEYELTHSRQQRETAEWLIENGADMIIGTHPHVAQDCEVLGGVQVAYSLGNAVSNMSAPNTQAGLMATVRLVRESNGDISASPVEFTWLWCSRPGGYCDSYCVIPIEEYLGRKNEWKDCRDYEKMAATYRHASKTTGIDNK